MLAGLPDWAMVVVICILTAAITEITSNVATANILLPVLGIADSVTQIQFLQFATIGIIFITRQRTQTELLQRRLPALLPLTRST